jgi:hypothetical protein
VFSGRRGCFAAPAFLLFTGLLRADCTLDAMNGYFRRQLFQPGQDRARTMFLADVRNRQSYAKSERDVANAGCEGKAYAWELLSHIARSTPANGDDWSRWIWQTPVAAKPSSNTAATAAGDFDTFEMVHMNDLAARHAAERMMSVKARKDADELGLRAFPEFPIGSTELKTIWRRIPQNGCVALGVWEDLNGKSIGNAVYGDQKWPRRVLVYDSTSGKPAPDCSRAASPTRDTDRQLRAQDQFIWMRVTPATRRTRFRVLNDVQMADNDLLILVGMHIARKDIADWAWVTAYWKAPVVSPTAQEVLGRDRVIPDSSPWSKYVVKYTLSFQFPCSGALCADQRNFVYNPYLEAVNVPNGTASNCVACHAKARYLSPKVGDIPDTTLVPVEFGGDLKLSRFEGTTMTDYSWTAAKP